MTHDELDLLSETSKPYQKINYLAGFRLSGRRFPYMLIQSHEKTDSLENIAGALKPAPPRKPVSKPKRDAAQNPIFGKPEIDQERKAVLVEIDANLPEIGQAKALMAVFPGSRRTVQLRFFSLPGDYKRQTGAFNGMIHSFTFDKGYGFGESQLAAFLSNLSPAVQKVFFGLALGLMVGGAIIGILRWSKNRERSLSAENELSARLSGLHGEESSLQSTDRFLQERRKSYS